MKKILILLSTTAVLFTLTGCDIKEIASDITSEFRTSTTNDAGVKEKENSSWERIQNSMN